MFSRRTDWSLAPNPLTRALREAYESGKTIIDLTVSNPTQVGITYNGPAILDSLRNEKSLDYNPESKGLLSAREAVAAYHKDRGETVDPQNLVLTASTSEAYSFLFRLLANPEEEILVPKPSYPLFEFLADLQDVKLAPYPLLYDHGWQIDVHGLEHALSHKSRAMVVVNPNNPTGSFISPEERGQLNEICKRTGMALIVDEVFLDYAHVGQRRPSFVTNADSLTFTMNGLSKISALPQMKLGWIAVSGPSTAVQDALARLEVIADTYLSVNTPVQLAAPILLDERKSIQPQLMRRIQENLHELDRQVGANRSCSRLEVEAGWYAVLRVPATESDEELAIELLRNCGVFVHPGHFYDFGQDGYLVMSLITEPAAFREGLSRILGDVGC
jgi:aspartate/methionine/tyrosine aminotransferase